MKRDKGQLAVGLAFAFTTVLAMLSLVLHSSFITREKMKVQQSSDLAALVASDVQRHNLNRIREHNEAIKDAYFALQVALTAASSPCLTFMPGIDSTGAKVLAKTFLGKNLDESKGDMCDKGCSSFDGYVHSAMISAYTTVHEYHVGEVINIILNANEYAFQNALDTLLIPPNLPFGLRRYLEDHHGRPLNPDVVRSLYEKGLLKDLYEAIEYDRKSPLFEPDIDLLIVAVPRMVYQAVQVGTKDQCLTRTYYVLPGPVGGTVYKNGDYVTSFVTGATYSPVTTEALKDIQLFVRNADPGDSKFGRSYRDDRGGKRDLFLYEDNSRKRVSMSALAAAKPYGGRFPEKGSLVPGQGVGDTGSDFQGSKLIGLADKDELDGFRLNLDGSIQEADETGLITETHRYFTEDFLH